MTVGAILELIVVIELSLQPLVPIEFVFSNTMSVPLVVNSVRINLTETYPETSLQVANFFGPYVGGSPPFPSTTFGDIIGLPIVIPPFSEKPFKFILADEC